MNPTGVSIYSLIQLYKCTGCFQVLQVSLSYLNGLLKLKVTEIQEFEVFFFLIEKIKMKKAC